MNVPALAEHYRKTHVELSEIIDELEVQLAVWKARKALNMSKWEYLAAVGVDIQKQMSLQPKTYIRRKGNGGKQ